MNIFSYDAATVLSLILTLMRISIVVFMLPIFSTQNIPITVKAAISVVLTLGVWPHLSVSGALMPQHPFEMVLMLLGEVVLGLVLGMAVNFLFMGIQSGGELLGFQMGFTMINFADPISGNQTGATAFFIWMVTALTFLVLDGHLHMLQGFAASFAIVPPGGVTVGRLVLDQVLLLSADVFILALKISAPVMVALFLVEVALGMMARTSPQIHIMEFGFPVKIAVGFFFLSLLLYIMAEHVAEFISGIAGLFINLLRAMSPLAAR
ncbi:flagellar biosynthetic protein FliR [uncultured Desulfovibrio sp.]|uniref:Flagellar biosynthetic protein FliR n=1 Tax=Candidatus Desulfovibrio intestinavium TaxID=2838534 RepID=A0A9D2KP88_9BACT|nr:flagellar biosynthetic protein FliR [uncultured Desulfovibrio sp.]HJA78507.1 flagellar biosynthetic protein FliR [Candidatus Desulfovibrio intestinavium]